MITQPIQAVPDAKNDIVRLRFDNMAIAPRGDKEKAVYTLDMEVRGAIAWPTPGIPGMAIIAGRDIKADIIWIFADYSFKTVDPIFDDHKGLETGLMLFISQTAWPRYACNYFYYYEFPGVYPMYRNALNTEGNQRILAPMGMVFKETVFADKDLADALIRERVQNKTIKWSEQSDFHRQVSLEDSRGRHALRCLMSGYHEFPWQDWREYNKNQ